MRRVHRNCGAGACQQEDAVRCNAAHCDARRGAPRPMARLTYLEAARGEVDNLYRVGHCDEEWRCTGIGRRGVRMWDGVGSWIWRDKF